MKKNKPNSFVRRRNPKLRYCIHDRSERQACAKCNAFNREQQRHEPQSDGDKQ